MGGIGVAAELIGSQLGAGEVDPGAMYLLAVKTPWNGIGIIAYVCRCVHNNSLYDCRHINFAL